MRLALGQALETGHSRAGTCGDFVGLALGLNMLEQNQGQGGELTVMAACLGGAAISRSRDTCGGGERTLARWATRLNIPEPIEKLAATSRWLPAVNILGSLLICALGFVTVFVADERAMRMGVAFAPLLLAYGIACLASQRRDVEATEAATSGVGRCRHWPCWSPVWPPCTSVGPTCGLLSESAAPLAYAGTSARVPGRESRCLYAVVVPRGLGTASVWHEPVRRASLVMAVATVSTLLVVLAMEVTSFVPGVGAPLATPEVIAISVMLGGFVVALFAMALWPGKDPLNLSEKGRTGYVYAAQCVTAVLCAHVYLADPQSFWRSGFFRRNWPFLVMLLAFGSVAFGEFCSRRNWRVISEPFLRTGGFLPLLPALAAWAFSQTSYPLRALLRRPRSTCSWPSPDGRSCPASRPA